MKRWKGLLVASVSLALFLPTFAGAGWAACSKVDYFCDNYDAVRAGSGDPNRSGVYGYSNGAGWGVFGRTTSYGKAAVGGENLGMGPAIEGTNSGGGIAIKGTTTSGAPTMDPAILGHNSGGGPGITGSSFTGEGIGGYSTNGVGVAGGSETDVAGRFTLDTPTNTNFALKAANLYGSGVHGQGKNNGVYGTAVTYGVQGVSPGGNGGFFRNTSATTTKPALKAQTAGKGWAGEFRATSATGRGVYIKTAGGQGLTVVGGTKNAAVSTSRGTRALYAEEAGEVYFSDYGFGRLKEGKAEVEIDPLFAETVNLSQDYFVFLQPYARAELFVSRTGPTSFEVGLSSGDPEAKFAYRLVAKRRGFETARMEVVPSPEEENYADNRPIVDDGLKLAQAQDE